MRTWYAGCSSPCAQLVLHSSCQGVQQVLQQLPQHLLLQLLHATCLSMPSFRPWQGPGLEHSHSL